MLYINNKQSTEELKKLLEDYILEIEELETIQKKKIDKIEIKKQRGIKYLLLWFGDYGVYTDFENWGQMAKVDDKRNYYQQTVKNILNIKIENKEK